MLPSAPISCLEMFEHLTFSERAEWRPTSLNFSVPRADFLAYRLTAKIKVADFFHFAANKFAYNECQLSCLQFFLFLNVSLYYENHFPICTFSENFWNINRKKKIDLYICYIQFYFDQSA